MFSVNRFGSTIRTLIKQHLCAYSTVNPIYELPSSGLSKSPSHYSKDEIPVCLSRKLPDPIYCSGSRTSRQAWVETLKPIDGSAGCESLTPIGMVDLNPDVFAVFPRIDLVHKNLYWQAHYRMVDWRCITTRAELPYRSNKKPWPQKGTGRARHGNRRTHIWLGGGQCHGPRGPESFFSLLPRDVRIAGLLSMLTIKHTQNDLHIVDDLRLDEALELKANQVWEETHAAMNDPERVDPLSPGTRARLKRFYETMNEAAVHVRDLVDQRRWGPSVLFVTDVASSHCLPQPEQEPTSWVDLAGHPHPALCLACSSYAEYIEAELSPESSAFEPDSVAPRATHPGRGLTLMPLHGLNVWSLVSHDTIVLSLRCLDLLEQRLVQAQRMLIRDEGLQPAISLTPPAWLSDLDYEHCDEKDHFKTRGRRHFSERVQSAYWDRLKYT